MPSKTWKKAVKKALHKHKIPRQRSIPGIEDARIAAIEKRAWDYAELRDQRLALLESEVEVKKKLIEAMHKAGKEEYKRNGITVQLTVEKEGVKVRLKSEEELPSEDELPEEPEKEEPGEDEEQSEESPA